MRILLVHWHATEIAERERVLADAGHVVRGLSDVARVRMSDVGAFAPDVVVVDLRRLPSHGREIAMTLLGRKASRSIPVVFIEGDEAKTARIREELPSATFTLWPGVVAAVRRAKTVSSPQLPRDLGSGYSGKPLVAKLGIRENTKLALVGAPKDFAATLGALPTDVRLTTRLGTTAETILLFVTKESQLSLRLPNALASLADKGALWVAWPKQAGMAASELREDRIREVAGELGLVDVKVCAIDPTWSGLCLRRRAAGASSPGSRGRGSASRGRNPTKRPRKG